MRRFVAGVVSATLAGALLAGHLAPMVYAANGSVVGVPVSLDWGHAIQGGGEVRIPFPAQITMSGTGTWTPVLGITQLCNQAAFSGTSCSGSTVNEIQRSAMLMDISSSSTITGCFSSQINPLIGGQFVTNAPQTAGNGVHPPPPNTPLCGSRSGGNGNIGCNDCYVSGTSVVLRTPYIAVIVPAGKASGTYIALITFAVL